MVNDSLSNKRSAGLWVDWRFSFAARNKKLSPATHVVVINPGVVTQWHSCLAGEWTAMNVAVPHRLTRLSSLNSLTRPDLRLSSPAWRLPGGLIFSYGFLGRSVHICRNCLMYFNALVQPARS